MARFTSTRLLAFASLLALAACSAAAQEKPYFVTYDHTMEDPGDLDIGIRNGIAVPRSAQSTFTAPYLEFEYGATRFWTSEFTLEGQSTFGDSTIFTGWRLENRFRLLQKEHKINPVLYFEYESINEGSRVLKEVVGNSQDFDEPNGELRREHAHEFEGKLILSSNVRGWNVAENFIAEKNVSEGEPFEFGYAFAVSRRLGRPAGKPSRFCREKLVGGVELYGGLGTTEGFGFHDTSHYLAPVLGWNITEESRLQFSPAVGLTHSSIPVFLRIGYSVEIEAFGSRVRSLFRRDRSGTRLE